MKFNIIFSIIAIFIISSCSEVDGAKSVNKPQVTVKAKEPEPQIKKVDVTQQRKLELVEHFCYAIQSIGVCDNLIILHGTEEKFGDKYSISPRGNDKKSNRACLSGFNKAFNDAESGLLCETAWKKYGCGGSEVPNLLVENVLRNDYARRCEFY